MRGDTKSVSIDAPVDRVIAFLEDPRNLPRWAVGFAKSVHETPNGWVIQTGAGAMGIRIESDSRTGTVDFWMSPTPGVDLLAASRVVPRGTASEFIFTQFQTTDMPDDVFARNIQALIHELSVLKALLEVECPL